MTMDAAWFQACSGINSLDALKRSLKVDEMEWQVKQA